ncbi:MAG: TRAP transporter large permease subunit, partial [Gracilibacteraceae bacterium]|nr:TRAP transporter large permease subunit [Gracilibacteraceae bacterium]
MAEVVVTALAVLLASLFLGAPVMAAIGFTGIVTMLVFMGGKFLIQFASIAYSQGTSMNQLVAPLFIMMAEFLARGGIAEDIYSVLNRLLRRFKGGLAIATTLACTVFAALCGSSPATAASIGRISVEQMTARRYRKDFAIGTVSGGGTLGIMIPPSITLVTYGILTETSIADLLMAGLVPGLMLSLLMCVSTVVRVRVSPELIGDIRPGRKFNPESYAVDVTQPPQVSEEDDGGTSWAPQFLRILPAFILIFIVLGSMYTGMATPTESAGIGAMGAMLIVVFLRRFSKQMFIDTMKATAKTGTMIIFLVIAGFCLSFVLSYVGV